MKKTGSDSGPKCASIDIKNVLLSVLKMCFDRQRPEGPRKALRGGISKVNCQETLSIFGDKCPQNGSKNDPMAPRTTLECPHEGPSVVTHLLSVAGVEFHVSQKLCRCPCASSTALSKRARQRICPTPIECMFLFLVNV